MFGRLREKSKSRENGQETKKQEWNVNLSSGSEKAYKTRVQLQAAVNQWTVLFSLSDSVKLAAPHHDHRLQEEVMLLIHSLAHNSLCLYINLLLLPLLSGG